MKTALAPASTTLRARGVGKAFVSRTNASTSKTKLGEVKDMSRIEATASPGIKPSACRMHGPC
jgi:hypothetical protein